MDGKALCEALRINLREASNSEFIDSRTSYDYLWEAAVEFVDRTNCLPETQAITTVSSTGSYDINADYLKLYMKNQDNDYFVKFYDLSTTTNHFITWKDYDDIVIADSTSSVAVSDNFCIVPNPDLDDAITSSATAAGASTGGKCTLSSDSEFGDVSIGDEVHNTDDGSDGVVVGWTSASTISTALFGGTNNDWTSGDSFVIQPQSRFQLVLDPEPSTAGDTVTLYYQKRPNPVYSDYDVYPIPAHYHQLLPKFAAWLYKYRDAKPQEGDALYQAWERGIQRAAASLNTALNRGKRIKVNFKSRQ